MQVFPYNELNTISHTSNTFNYKPYQNIYTIPNNYDGNRNQIVWACKPNPHINKNTTHYINHEQDSKPVYNVYQGHAIHTAYAG